MSTTSSTSSSTSSTSTGYQLTSLNSSSQLQVTGLASGLDTNSIVQALVGPEQQRITNTTNQENAASAQASELQKIQTDLQTVATDAQALMDPSLFDDTQAVTSTSPTVISAAASSGVGAVQGGYEVGVTALAAAAQKTFSYTPPPSGSSAYALTIDGKNVTMSPGESIASFVQAINSNSKLDVYAAATTVNTDGSGTVVLSDRLTGDQGNSYINVTDPGTALTQTTDQQSANFEGQDAQYTINGVAQQPSTSNTLTTAIPGVTLTLNGTTAASGPVTVDVSAPAPSESNVQSAVQTFITAYNSVIGEIQAQVSQSPSSSQPTQGTLYSDPGLSDLLTSMRQAMYATQSGTAPGLTSMLDLGVSTGAAAGNAAPSQSAIDGNLTLNAATLQSAMQSDAGGVQSVLIGWANSFASIVDNQAGPGGIIDTRVNQDHSQASDLASQIATMNQALQLKEAQLEQQFAQMESALSQNQSESSWLTSQISKL